MRHDDPISPGRQGWWGPRSLLGQRGSLTATLRRRLAGPVSAELLSYRKVRLSGRQAGPLSLKPGSVALRREVFLWSGDQRVLFARSDFPLASRRGRGRALKTLGQRPLGDVLFAGRSWSATVPRRRMVLVRLLRGHEDQRALRTWSAAWASSQPLWGRRSIVLLGATPIAIHEYLLHRAARTALPKNGLAIVKEHASARHSSEAGYGTP